jgi:hypothetical protein
MALAVNTPDESLVMLGDPTEAEKGRPDAKFFKQIQDFHCIIFN